jgi:hypothetical protein
MALLLFFSQISCHSIDRRRLRAAVSARACQIFGVSVVLSTT